MTKVQETEHYEIIVGENPYDNNYNQYLVINKETKVIEADSRMLPMAKKYILELEAYYNAVEDMADDGLFDEIEEEELQPISHKRH